MNASRFIEWLRKEGFDVRGRVQSRSPGHGTRYALNLGDGALYFRDTDEEQPELLVWGLKELERRGVDWHLQPSGTAGYVVIDRAPHMSRGKRIAEGPTMTAAVLEALVGGE